MSRDPRASARQLHEGRMYADTFAARNLWRIGEENPMLDDRWRARNGQYLAGFGGQQMRGQLDHDPMYRDRCLAQLEEDEDNEGSGIFDQQGRQATSNANMGVFASSWALPGYIAREVPFTVSRDVRDITDNAAIVNVPAGGMSYIERDGKSSGALIQPAALTEHDEVYAYLTGQPKRAVLQPYPMPIEPRLSAVVAAQNDDLSMAPIYEPMDEIAPIGPAMYPAARAAPDLPQPSLIPYMSTRNLGMARPLPVSGLGGAVLDKLKEAPVWSWAVIGLMLGAAGAFVWESYR